MLILRPTKEPLVLTRGPADWQAHLDEPEKHRKDGLKGWPFLCAFHFIGAA